MNPLCYFGVAESAVENLYFEQEDNMEYIECKNLKLHNLKNINLTISKRKLTIITGVSGSGKSTLAFDILMQVGQSKYLSAIGIIPERDTASEYDVIGLSPTVCVSQNLKRQ